MPVLALRPGQGGADERHFPVGWGAPEPGHAWTVGDESILLLDRPAGAGDLLLEIACAPFLPPGTTAQRVDVLADFRHAGSFALAAPGRIACRIPAASAAPDPRITITLLLPDAAPRQDGGRRVALAVEEVRLSAAPPAPAPGQWHLSARIAGPQAAGPRRRLRSRREAQFEPPGRDIERLRALLQEEPGPAAARLLDRIVARRGGGLFAFPQLATAAMEAAVRLGHAETVSDAIAEQYGVEARIVIDRAEQDHRGAGAVLWSVGGRRQRRLPLPPGPRPARLRGHDHRQLAQMPARLCALPGAARRRSGARAAPGSISSTWAHSPGSPSAISAPAISS